MNATLYSYLLTAVLASLLTLLPTVWYFRRKQREADQRLAKQLRAASCGRCNRP
ncbi:hypothetical protein [Amycolatopsis samaneae]|uniref:Uncharacterized protein n=1 Tax=Amycolatopsis samaneae TaxID=664691 RepID=A0ABW5GU29_9PSEU